MTYVAGPFNGPHLYLQWGGSLPGGEQWSNGIRFAPTPGFTAVYESAMHDAINTAIQGWHTRPESAIHPRALLQFVKLNLIGTDGHYAETVTHERIVPNVPGTGTATVIYPNQVALAITLRSAVSRGPANKGRFYSPMPALAVGTDGEINTTERNYVQVSATTLLTALNAASAHYNVAVFSRKLGAAQDRVVTSVAVGRVLDTQRRRRRSLAENY